MLIFNRSTCQSVLLCYVLLVSHCQIIKMVCYSLLNLCRRGFTWISRWANTPTTTPRSLPKTNWRSCSWESGSWWSRWTRSRRSRTTRGSVFVFFVYSWDIKVTYCCQSGDYSHFISLSSFINLFKVFWKCVKFVHATKPAHFVELKSAKNLNSGGRHGTKL